MTSPIILIIGTRPEGIKMLPLYFACKRVHIPVILCSTAQHSDLLNEVYQLFNVEPDYQLSIMQPNQDLFHITQEGLRKTKQIFLATEPSLVVVQGDTTSSMTAALSAFYLGISIAHVEAGLRTNDVRNPFPEEMNRRFISMIARYHFAPTASAVAHLLKENINRDTLFCTGNTVVDALRIIEHDIKSNKLTLDPIIQKKITSLKEAGKQIVLLTTHRRESFNGGITTILTAMKEFALSHPDVFFFYPYHPNPKVLDAIEESDIAHTPNIYTTKPLLYKDLVYILLNSDWVATDSGGIEEEAISLGKRVLILREKTERIEGIWEGLAKLVGTNKIKILHHMKEYASSVQITEPNRYSIYGDGYAADKIARILIAHRTQFSAEQDKTNYQKTSL